MPPKKTKFKSGQSVLLFLLWKRFGGPIKVAHTLGVPWYQPGNWDRDGCVPVKYIQKVAKTLKVPVWGLNYKAAQFLYPEDKVPTWKEVAAMYKLEPEQVRQIVKFGPP